MKYAAIITDLDGTVMPSVLDGMPSEAVVTAAKRYSENHILCAATGRTWRHAKSIIRALELTQPCILSGGAQIIDPVREQILWEVSIDLATCRQIIEIARMFPFEVAYSEALTVTDLADPSTIELTEAANTIYILNVANDKVDEILEALKVVPGITVSKAGSWTSNDVVDLHITSAIATKEHGVAELCKILGVEAKDVAGIGDGLNDIHLFVAVGHKIAMGNAADQLKASADEVIGSLDEDGWAKYINSL